MSRCPRCKIKLDRYSKACPNCGWLYDGSWRWLKFLLLCIVVGALIAFLIF